jgi:putative inorganic carbon (HCO3(-)) transporter
VHFGLETYVPTVLYLGFWLVVVLSIFWKPVTGIYYLIPIIPAQTFRDGLAGFPLGENVVTIVLIAVAIGLLRKGQPVFPQSRWRVPLFVYAGFTFLSLCAGSFYLGHTAPIYFSDSRFGDWRNYITMLFMLFLVAGAVTTTKQMKIVILLICLSVLLFDRNFWGTVSDRDYSTYSDDLRDAGAMGYAGSNGLAAFEAQVAIALMALAAFEKKLSHKLGYIGLAVFSTICLLYSLSRGAYVALLAGWVFLGLVKYRVLLIVLVVFGLTWTTVVPNAVVERVFMTEDSNGDLDHSAETRMTLWEDAMQVFNSNPVTGTGFNTYAYMERVGNYRDTHNIYVKVLVETGVAGLLLFLWLLLRTFASGFNLFRRAADPFHQGLGLALACWMVCTAAANFFGDRWSYLQVNGYMWILGGLVARAWIIEQEKETEIPDTEAEPAPKEESNAWSPAVETSFAIAGSNRI